MLAIVSQEHFIPMNNLKNNWLAQSAEVLQRIQEVIKSGYWIQGPEHNAFENELASYLNVSEVIAVASGTDALKIAMLAVGCKKDSKVITVANAGGYASIAAAEIGCEVIYCDISPDSMLIDPIKLKKILSSEIQAVVVTHLYGNIAPIEQIKEMCKEFEVVIIEDCAQAIGGTVGEEKVGSIGDISAFSFYPTKNLGAMGDGGAIATDNSGYAEAARKLRQYGWGSKYKIDIPGGVNSRLDEVQAAILRIGLNHVDEFNQARLGIVDKYRIALQGSITKLITSISQGSVAHLAVLIYENETARNQARELFSKYLIQTDIHYPILDSEQLGLPASKYASDLSVSVSTNTRILSIPLFPGLGEDELKRICNVLRMH